MKLAIISDVHGNYKALEAFLAYIGVHPVDGIICLGDYDVDSFLKDLFFLQCERSAADDRRRGSFGADRRSGVAGSGRKAECVTAGG